MVMSRASGATSSARSSGPSRDRDEDERVQATTLCTLTWAGVILPCIGLSLALSVLPQLRPQIPMAVFALTFSSVSLVLTYRHRLRVATWVFLLGFMVLMLAVLLGTGLGIRSTAFDLGILVAVLAGLLLGWRAALFIAVVHIALLCGTFVAEQLGHLPPPIFPPSTVWLWCSRLFFDAWILVGLGLGLRRMEMAQAKLETRVDARTEQLGTARDQALAAIQTKSDFLASMSHEIRTPMNAVIGMTGLLLETELSEQQQGFTQVVRGSGEALLELINDVLDFSKIEAGELVIERVPTDVRECVENATQLLLPAAQSKGLELFAAVEKNVPVAINGDPTRLQQVLVNLLSNAVKFTDRGEIVVRLEFGQSAGGVRELHGSVRDTGIGIPAELVPNLFDAFTQADATSTRRFGGTGLGLTICKRLLEAMGGRIWVESERGVGSTFHFTVPGKKVLPARPSRAGIGGGPPTPVRAVEVRSKTTPADIRILVAEDNPINQKLARLTLEQLGHRVEVVSTGHEAIEALERVPYDVVLMDVHMPQLGGLEAIRIIRSRSELMQPYVAAVTADATPEDRLRCRQAGMDDYVSKPYHTDDLRKVLERYAESVEMVDD